MYLIRFYTIFLLVIRFGRSALKAYSIAVNLLMDQCIMSYYAIKVK